MFISNICSKFTYDIQLIKKNDGEEYMISPFAPVNLPLINEFNSNQN